METRDERKTEEPVLEKPGPETPEVPMEGKVKTHKSTARLGKDIQHQIGLQLRKVWAEVVEEGVPERFAELIKRSSDARYGKGNG